MARLLSTFLSFLVSPLMVLGAGKDTLVVRPTGPSTGILEWQGRRYACALGKGGVAPEGEKREGDGKTPAGQYPLRGLYYRADKVGLPKTALQATAITREDGWCDAPGEPEYNRIVHLPFAASHEDLWRDKDDLYDLIVPIGYNDDPVVPGKGSAIFFHVARHDYSPTAGCVAVSKQDFLEILATLGPGCTIRILPGR